MLPTCGDADRVCNLTWGVKVVTKPWTQRMVVGALGAFLAAGCASLPSWAGKKDETPKAAGARDSFVLRGRGLEKDKTPVDDAVQAELDDAKRLYQSQEYKKAQPIFAKLANNSKNPVNVGEEARFFEADCQYMQGNHRDAAGTFKKYFKEFRNGAYQEQANRRVFDIANYWLDETRRQMAEYEEVREGKRYLVKPASFVYVTKDMPFLDREGHATGLLQEVYLNDLRGPLGERALFYLATIKFFREEYKEADFYYQQLYENFPNSQLASKAIKQSIICKQVCNHGTAYDSREVENSRKLIDTAARAYPELGKDEAWMQRQLVAVNLQQADRDFRIAEFYRRMKHPGSAYFYYELVQRRYPNTDYANKAGERIAELRSQVQDNATAAGDSSTSGGALSRILSPFRGSQDPSQAPRMLPPSFANSPGP